jgi:hypothetical protein
LFSGYSARFNTSLESRQGTLRICRTLLSKLEDFEAAVGLQFAHDNFVKRRSTLRTTPAMAAGIERDFWTVKDLVEAA